MKIGSLFSGYGGLDMAVSAVTGAQTVWHSDIEPGASKILAHHWPETPNHGDLTKIDWSQVEPVNILTGGFPCQDLSHAGKRAGLKPGTRSGLWSHMAYAINHLRPSLVVFENVRGLLSARAASDLEPCPWCVGDDEGDALRALGSVLGDLAVLGYDCAWVGLRAADVGAPHGRFRVFGVAWPAAADSDGAARGWIEPGGIAPSTAQGVVREAGRGARRDRGTHPAPTALLPTPAVNDMGEGKTPQAWDEWTARMKAAHRNGNGHGASLAIEAQRLLPTPTRQDGANNGGPSQAERNTIPLNALREWGDYATAIARWESLTRPAPAPTMTSAKGTPQLSPAFSEWLMGLPAGHVTDVPGLSRAQMLKALGNGVVPAQAAAALTHLLNLIPVMERAS